jgi:pyrroloquinoline quinone (PQQ) biosynthesis protein C
MFQLEKIEAARARLLQHPMYAAVDTPEKVRILMQHHVFAVWDFMSLLKRLQRDLTCVEVPWLPPKHPQYARFINEIVLAEESDEDGRGNYASHFDLYLEAMHECGAETGPITRFLQALSSGSDPLGALDHAGAPPTVQQFAAHTLQVARHGRSHEVAAAFFYGREDLIPQMFQSLADALEQHGAPAQRLLYYLHRHIELDADQHGPLAKKLLAHLCDEDPSRRVEAEQVALSSLESREQLWNGVLMDLH